jgi:hypothetical protein
MVCLVAVDAAEPRRLKRSEGFLGIHFDFHAGPDCKEVGKNTTPQMIEEIINQVRPDYLQIDCKGHPGFCSYPTRVGNPAPGILGDPLRMWREVTARRGVSLYMHYSGVWDGHAVSGHPAWGAVNADGKANGKATSFFGDYAEKLLIPQLRELAGDYGVDGMWVDGECWASVPDYSPAAVAAFQKATGISTVPKKPGDTNWFEFLEFHREAFRKYLRHYVAEMKRTHPQFELCSNWAFTDHMPEAVSAPVDFLSGDYSPQDSVNSARLSARFLARQGRPWDLMAWSFSTSPKRAQKTTPQLQREAAVVLAMGGGFQAYFTQNRDGSVRLGEMPVMAEVAKFCRARQELCHRSEAVPQVAVLFSTAAHYRKINGLFSRDPARMNGVLQALLESQQSVELLAEHHLQGRLSEYPLVVVPEWEYLEPKFKSDLAAYVKAGGNLLLIGPRSAALFREELGTTFDGDAKAARTVHLEHKGRLVSFKGEAQTLQPGPGAVVFGKLHATNDPNSPAQPAAVIRTMGKGKIAATSFAFGRSYAGAPEETTRQFLHDLVRQLVPRPMVAVKGGAGLDVCVARQREKLLVNLVNASGPHRTQSIIESIAPVGPLQLAVQLKARPARVTLEPGARPLETDYQNGELRVKVPRVDIHDIVVIAP